MFRHQRVGDRRHVAGQIAIGLDGDQGTRLRQPWQGRAQVLTHGAAHLGRVFHHAFQAVIQGQPFDGRFRAAFRYARHVVDGIADQRQIIDDAVRRHAELGQHGRFVELFIAHGIDQGHLAVDQLRQVLVARGDHHVHAGGGRLHGQGANHVIGFHAVDHQDGPAHGAHGFVDRFDLQAQVVRHRGARGLVLGIHIVAESFTLGIEHAGDVGGRVIGAQAAQHVDHAVHGARGITVRAAQVGQRMEGAIKVTGTVD